MFKYKNWRFLAVKMNLGIPQLKTVKNIKKCMQIHRDNTKWLHYTRDLDQSEKSNAIHVHFLALRDACIVNAIIPACNYHATGTEVPMIMSKAI